MWNWFRLRARRKASLQFVRQKLIDAKMFDYRVKRMGGFCHLCREDTFRILKVETKIALSGEAFRFFSERFLGHLCPRCECVGRYPDTSGDKVHIHNWEPVESPLWSPS